MSQTGHFILEANVGIRLIGTSHGFWIHTIVGVVVSSVVHTEVGKMFVISKRQPSVCVAHKTSLAHLCVTDGSKSDSDDNGGPTFSTYSSSSAFEKLSPSKKGNVSVCATDGCGPGPLAGTGRSSCSGTV